MTQLVQPAGCPHASHRQASLVLTCLHAVQANPVGSSMAAPSSSALEDTEPQGEEGTLSSQKSVAVNLTEMRAKDRDLLSPAQMSSSEHSHKAPVTDLVWLPAFRPPRSDGRPHQVPQPAPSAHQQPRQVAFGPSASLKIDLISQNSS